MYSSVGKDHLEDSQARKKEWNLAVEELRGMAEYAEGKGIKLALELLNRFETDMLNTVKQGMNFINETGCDNIGFHLDTFHMHLEEKSSPEAIRLAGNKIFHFQPVRTTGEYPGRVRFTGRKLELR
jgi:D-psicose/D-tagatose/L-ribulose 3-epimerase